MGLSQRAVGEKTSHGERRQSADKAKSPRSPRSSFQAPVVQKDDGARNVGPRVPRVKGKRMQACAQSGDFFAKRVVTRVKYSSLYYILGDGRIMFLGVRLEANFLFFINKKPTQIPQKTN